MAAIGAIGWRTRASSKPDMKRWGRAPAVRAGIVLLAFAGLGLILSLPVTTRQGINYTVTTQRIPLSLKLLAFLHRHEEYRHLARALTGRLPDRDAKIMALFDWTREHIRPYPKGYPIVDDHVWNTIVRGYGTPDQVADVFATLCVTAGIPAHFEFITIPGTNRSIGIAFARLSGGGFGIFDPAHGVAVRHPDGRLATVEEVRADPSIVERAAPGLEWSGAPYVRYFERLPGVSRKRFSKTTEQVPLLRVWKMVRNVIRCRER